MRPLRPAGTGGTPVPPGSDLLSPDDVRAAHGRMWDAIGQYVDAIALDHLDDGTLQEGAGDLGQSLLRIGRETLGGVG